MTKTARPLLSPALLPLVCQKNKQTHPACPPLPDKVPWESQVEISALDTSPQFGLYHILCFIELLLLCHALNLDICQTTYWNPLPDSQSAASTKDALSGQRTHKPGELFCKWNLRAGPMLPCSKFVCFIDISICFTKSKEGKNNVQRTEWSSICFSFTWLHLLQPSCVETSSPKAFKKRRVNMSEVWHRHNTSITHLKLCNANVEGTLLLIKAIVPWRCTRSQLQLTVNALQHRNSYNLYMSSQLQQLQVPLLELICLSKIYSYIRVIPHKDT